MNPFFFGSSERALFGAYHAPKTQPARNAGVVICNPFGDEAIKAHRALLQLAKMLSAERFHVLRFDYFATGDSMGDGSEATVDQWIEDVGAAADELKDTTGVKKVSYVGLRLGGTLALLGASGRRDVGRVVLWDPIVNGRDYLQELRRVHEAYVGNEFSSWGPDREASGMTSDEIMGFPVKRELKEGMNAIDMASVALKRLRRSSLVVSIQSDAYKRLNAHLTDLGVEVEYNHVPVGVNWNADETMESSLVPKEALQAIVTALT